MWVDVRIRRRAVDKICRCELCEEKNNKIGLIRVVWWLLEVGNT